MTRPTDTAVCIYCGTERPRSEATCPTCERGWIDRRIVATGAASPGTDTPTEAAAAGTADVGATGTTVTTGPVPADAPSPLPGEAAAAPSPSGATDRTMEKFLSGEVETEAGRRFHPVMIGFGIALLLFGIGDLVWSRLGDSPADAAPTTTAATTTAPTTTAAPTTTMAATTTAAVTTTVAPSTTIARITPSGDPVVLEDLTLGAFALGPLEIGSPAPEVLGRLAGGLGQPDAITALSGGEHGLCADSTGSAARWGTLEIITVAGPDGGTFAGYRSDLAAAPDSATVSIPTISGLRLGDSISDLQSTYSGLTVFFPDGTTFVLQSASGQVLLWGPVSGTGAEGIIEGIYSPNACDGGAG